MSLEELQQQEWFGVLAFFLYIVCLMLTYSAIVGGYRHYEKLHNRLKVWEESVKRSRKYKRDMRLMCKIITHALENAEYDGEITQATKQHYYHQFGMKCGLIDLLPRKLQKQYDNKKEEIKDRLGPNTEKKLAALRAKPKKQDNNLVMLQARLKKSA